MDFSLQRVWNEFQDIEISVLVKRLKRSLSMRKIQERIKFERIFDEVIL